MRLIIAALSWEIRSRNRRLAWLAVGLIPLLAVINQLIPARFLATEENCSLLMTLDSLFLSVSILFVFAVFNVTEFSPEREWNGFPYRLFTLPVPTWLLTATPMLFGIACAEGVFWAAVKLVFTRVQMARPEWFAVLIGAYLVFYLAILWSLAGIPIARTIVLGLTGTSVIAVALMPFAFKDNPSPWFGEGRLIGMLSAVAFAAFLVAWKSVARQRHGGGKRRNWSRELIERLADLLPRRRRDFGSAAAAQLWFEWRRRGMFLPACVAGVMGLVIVPLSYFLQEDAAATPWILGWTLALPVLLAAPIGLGILMPDTGSPSVSLSPFTAVKPLATGEMIVAKMKLAAVSTIISWLLVILFLALWLPLWANLDALNMVRIGFWMVYDHSVYPQFVIAALFLVAGVLVTWKFLVGGLWLTFRGRRQLSARATAGLLGFLALAIGLPYLELTNHIAIHSWMSREPNQALAVAEWLAVIVIAAKSWCAAVWWRAVTPGRTRQYLLAWAAGTICLMALAVLIWAHGVFALLLESWGFSSMDPTRLERLLILLALLVIPLARPGLAPSLLARRRHE